jgi:hypothetical protein
MIRDNPWAIQWIGFAGMAGTWSTGPIRNNKDNPARLVFTDS